MALDLQNLRLPLSLMLLIGGAGCSSNKNSVPQDAQLIAERSAGLLFDTPWPGTVFITSKNNGKVIYSTPVTTGDRLFFYPETKRIILNGNIVKEDSTFDPKQVHRLYFLKG